MKIEVIRNLQFSRLVKTGDRLREFNFTKLRGLMEGFFSVDVADEKGNRIIFLMEQMNNHWQISTDDVLLPSWITGSFDKLNEIIQKALDNYDPDFFKPALTEEEQEAA
jgi:hypothetical protein